MALHSQYGGRMSASVAIFSGTLKTPSPPLPKTTGKTMISIIKIQFNPFSSQYFLPVKSLSGTHHLEFASGYQKTEGCLRSCSVWNNLIYKLASNWI
jgi:hypothetical protein